MKLIKTDTFDIELSKHVKPLYSFLDGGHNTEHLRNSYTAIKKLVIKAYKDKEIEYVDAFLLRVAVAYHDVGRIISRDNHEKHSVTIFNNDALLSNIILLDNKEKEIVSKLILEHEAKGKFSGNVPKQLMWDACHIYLGHRYTTIERTVAYQCDISPNTNPKDESLIKSIREQLESSYKGKWRSNAANSLYIRPNNIEITDREIESKINTHLKNKKGYDMNGF